VAADAEVIDTTTLDADGVRTVSISSRARSRKAAVELQTREAPAKESFAALLDESLGVANSLEGTVIKGRVIALENDAVLIDVGLKSEGRVPLKEFAAGSAEPELHVGDTVEVYLERMEDKNGEAQLSREKARREEAWTQLDKSFQANERVTGLIFGRVKGGFTVDLNGAVAFLPGSQVDIRPVRDISPLLDRRNPSNSQDGPLARQHRRVAPCRAGKSRAEQRSELVASLKEGRSATASSRTSPTTAPLSISAASTGCCTSPISPGAASTTRPRL
jgi:small subunit ribosomal protein S1